MVAHFVSTFLHLDMSGDGEEDFKQLNSFVFAIRWLIDVNERMHGPKQRCQIYKLQLFCNSKKFTTKNI